GTVLLAVGPGLRPAGVGPKGPELLGPVIERVPRQQIVQVARAADVALPEAGRPEPEVVPDGKRRLLEPGQELVLLAGGDRVAAVLVVGQGLLTVRSQGGRELPRA